MPFEEALEAEALIIADQQDLRWPEHMDLAASLLVHRVDAGLPLRLLLCNPDLIYPVAPGRVGLTAGPLAAMLEAIIRERWPDQGIGFVRLGKPAPALFENAIGLDIETLEGDALVVDERDDGLAVLRAYFNQSTSASRPLR